MNIEATLKAARQDIMRLRRENEILGAKVEVMDSFMQVLHTHPAKRLETQGLDVIHEIENHLGRIEDERLKENAKPESQPRSEHLPRETKRNV